MYGKSRPITALILALLVAAGAIAAFALDMPVFRFVNQYVAPHIKMPVANQLIAGFEQFGQLVPIVVIGAAAWRLDRRYGRKVAIRLLLAASIASLVSEGGKALVGRHRPKWFAGQTWAQTWVDVGLHPRSGRLGAFFSGHTSAAAAAATVLSVCYPPVRPVAIIAAAGCGASRIAVRQHWISDVYFGGLAGLVVGWLFVPRDIRNRGRPSRRQGQVGPEPVTCMDQRLACRSDSAMAQVCRRRNMRRYWIILFLVAGGVLACLLDMPAYHFVDKYVEGPRYDRSQLVQGLEDFAQTVPPLAICWVVWRMDRRHGREIVIRMFLAFVMAGAVTGVGKLAVGRYRPEYFKGQTWGQTWIDVGFGARKSREQSFFSGHSAAAFTIAVGLSAYYPPLRPVAYTLATGCALSRVATENHWLSDVYLGSLTGVMLGWLFLPAWAKRSRRERDLRRL